MLVGLGVLHHARRRLALAAPVRPQAAPRLRNGQPARLPHGHRRLRHARCRPWPASRSAARPRPLQGGALPRRRHHRPPRRAPATGASSPASAARRRCSPSIALIAVASMAGHSAAARFRREGGACSPRFLEAALAGRRRGAGSRSSARSSDRCSPSRTAPASSGAPSPPEAAPRRPTARRRLEHPGRAGHPRRRDDRARHRAPARARPGASRRTPTTCRARATTTSRSGTASSPPSASRPSSIAARSRCCSAQRAWVARLQDAVPPIVDAVRGLLGERPRASTGSPPRVTIFAQRGGLPQYLATILVVFVLTLGGRDRAQPHLADEHPAVGLPAQVAHRRRHGDRGDHGRPGAAADDRRAARRRDRLRPRRAVRPARRARPRAHPGPRRDGHHRGLRARAAPAAAARSPSATSRCSRVRAGIDRHRGRRGHGRSSASSPSVPAGREHRRPSWPRLAVEEGARQEHRRT